MHEIFIFFAFFFFWKSEILYHVLIRWIYTKQNQQKKQKKKKKLNDKMSLNHKENFIGFYWNCQIFWQSQTGN